MTRNGKTTNLTLVLKADSDAVQLGGCSYDIVTDEVTGAFRAIDLTNLVDMNGTVIIDPTSVAAVLIAD